MTTITKEEIEDLVYKIDSEGGIAEYVTGYSSPDALPTEELKELGNAIVTAMANFESAWESFCADNDVDPFM